MNPPALFTVQEFKTHEGITSAAHDAIIAALADRAADAIERYCRRVVLAGAYTEVFDGGGSTVVLRNPPVASITSVKESETGDFASATAIPAADYVVDADAGTLRLRTRTFVVGFGTVQVVYAGGFDEIPNTLKEAAILWASYWMGRRRTAGLQSQTVGGVTSSWQSGGVPAEVRELLDRYRRPRLP